MTLHFTLTPKETARLMDEVHELRERVRQLEAALTVPDYTPRAWKLTPKQDQMLRVILKSAPGVLTYGRLTIALYGDHPDGHPGEKCIHVMICQIRAKLRKAGTPVEIKTVWGEGYRMTSEDAAWCHDKMDAERVRYRPRFVEAAE